jgi:hypothetical protein
MTTEFTQIVASRLCRPNAQGLYGRRSAARLPVTYSYELEVESVQAGNITNAIIPDLEIDFNMKLSMKLFPANCSNGVPSQLEGVVGLSTRGLDTVRDDLNCEDFTTTTTTVADVTDDLLLPQNTTTCVVVDGKLILFFVDQLTKNQIDWSGTVVTQLKNQMANGRFLSANEAIRRVSMIDLTTGAPSATPTPTMVNLTYAPYVTPTIFSTLKNAMDNNQAVYFGIIFGPLVLLFVCVSACVFFGCRRDDGQDDDKEMLVSDAESDDKSVDYSVDSDD